MSDYDKSPLRFKVKLPEGKRHPNGTDLEYRFGVYFPATDLCITDMGGRGTGIPEGANLEWIDDPKHLPWYKDPSDAGGFEGSKSKTYKPT